MIDPGIGRLEPKLKEVLYQCLEEIRATKAALYLINHSEDQYRLITQYGYRDNARKEVNQREELIDRMVMKRSPFYVNSVAEDPRFSEMLFNVDTSRMLVAPIMSRGKLVGFVDMRDKAAKEPFGPDDITAAQHVADRFLRVFADQGLFGQHTDEINESVTSDPGPVRTSARLDPLIVDVGSSSVVGEAVSDAQRAIGHGVLRVRGIETLSEAQLNAGAMILPSILTVPSVVMAAFSSFGRLGGYQVIAASAPLSTDAVESFQGKLRAWLQKRGEPESLSRTNTVLPLGDTGPMIETSRLVSMLSAPVSVGGIRGLVLTVAFENAPTPQAKARLAEFLQQIQTVVEHAISHETLRARNQRVAEKLLEPDFSTFPLLAEHSRRVSEMTERFCQFLGLSPEETEMIRLAALVHDVGFRLLDHQRLYRKKAAVADDILVMRKHAIVGAALVADSPLGPEIANLVLRHHERVDGSGYPDGIHGDAIPLGSRILHLCESFDAMTSEDSYQPPIPEASALTKIRRAAGSQFDEQLATKFIEMLGGDA